MASRSPQESDQRCACLPYNDAFAITPIVLTHLLFFTSIAACFFMDDFPVLASTAGTIGSLTWALIQSTACILYDNNRCVYTTCAVLGVLVSISSFTLRTKILKESYHFDTWCDGSDGAADAADPLWNASYNESSTFSVENENDNSTNTANDGTHYFATDDDDSSSCSNMQTAFGVIFLLAGILWLVASLFLLIFAHWRLSKLQQDQSDDGIPPEQAERDTKPKVADLESMEKGQNKNQPYDHTTTMELPPFQSQSPKVQKEQRGLTRRAVRIRDADGTTEYSESTTTTITNSSKRGSKRSILLNMTKTEGQDSMSDTGQPKSPRSNGKRMVLSRPTKKQASRSSSSDDNDDDDNIPVPLTAAPQQASKKDLEPLPESSDETGLSLPSSPQDVRALLSIEEENAELKLPRKTLGMIDEAEGEATSNPVAAIVETRVDSTTGLNLTSSISAQGSALTLDEAFFVAAPDHELAKRKQSRRHRKSRRGVTDADVVGTLEMVPEDVSTLGSDMGWLKPENHKKKKKKKKDSHSTDELREGKEKKKKKKSDSKHSRSSKSSKSKKSSSSDPDKKKKKEKERDYPDDGINLAAAFAPAEFEFSDSESGHVYNNGDTQNEAKNPNAS